MKQQQPTTVWTEALRLLALIRSLFVRLFPFARKTHTHSEIPSDIPSNAQERIASVTDSSAPFQPQSPSVNGQPHNQPTEPQGEEALALESAPGESVGELEQMEMDGVDEAEAESLPLVSMLESLLFVADEPVEPARLAQALRCSRAEVERELGHLRTEYERHNRGVRLQERDGKIQLVTNPAAAQAVEDFLSLDLTTRLSGPALETLAIIAYRQPVTRIQIEAVRGVDCSGMVRKLEQQGLVEEVGRLETPGRPILYGVTDLFLQHFGLTHLEELPALPELDADSLAATLALAE